jgi:hypothetical protein
MGQFVRMQFLQTVVAAAAQANWSQWFGGRIEI